jgi:hypothetical protein
VRTDDRADRAMAGFTTKAGAGGPGFNEAAEIRLPRDNPRREIMLQ